MCQIIFALFIALLTLNAELELLLFHVVCVLSVDEFHIKWRCKFSVNCTLIQTLSQIKLTGVLGAIRYSIWCSICTMYNMKKSV